MKPTSTFSSRREPVRRPLAVAVASACLGLAALAPVYGQALPSGMQVVRGSATVSTQGSAMTVTNSANAILNWQSFSIGSGQQVRFQQPGASSQVLNRVLGNDPSTLLGGLSSNGRVWLLNPNGVIFGRDARVDVAGLVAGTLNVNDSDWLAGRYRLDAGPSPVAGAGVANLGDIRTPLGGRVLLVSDGSVRNEGRIDAPGGQVALVSARQVELVDSARPNIVVSAPAGEVLNLGQLRAAGGRVDLQGAMVNQQGLVSADAIGRGPGGEVLLQASGDTLVSGTVSARSEAGAGGDVRLLGRHVGVFGRARVDASGAAGGGQVLVGGGLQGRDPSVPNAEASFVGADAVIAADATQSGDGGRIVVWSDHATRVYGTLLARGGAAGGNGGFIETSGGWLDAAPRLLSTAAPAGRAGQWLLDPHDLLIGDNVSPDTNISGGPDFTTTGDSAQINTSTLLAALNAGSDVTVTTSSGGTQAGDITLSFATLVPSNTLPVTLTFNAAHDINLVSTVVSASGSPLTLVFNGGAAGTVSMLRSSIMSGGGDVRINAPALALDSSSIDASAGHIGVRADSVRLVNDSQLMAFSSGDAMVLEGFSGRFINSFFVEPGSDLLVDGGRWLVYAQNFAAFDASPLSYGFVQYGDTPLQDSFNNGVVYNLAPTVTLGVSGGASKVYDGNTAISLDPATLSVSGGAINGDSVSLASATSGNVAGTFSDKNAGTGKAISLDPSVLIASDTSGRTVFGYAATSSGDITPAPLLLSANAGDKVYDGNTAAVVSSSLSGLVGSETLVVNASGSFADRNVGAAKPVTVSASLADGSNGGLAANYQLVSSTAVTQASITPRPLTLAVSASDKVYDASSTAAVGASLSGLVGSETLLVSASGSFSDPNVGTAKPVAVSVSLADGANGGLAGNYQLSSSTALASASITPATLSYVATPAQIFFGQPLPALGGSVTGFVGGDTLNSATSGQLGFSTPAVNGSPPGSYAVLGGGLTAVNYVFVQDPANDHALQVLGQPPATNDTKVALSAAIDKTTPPPVPPSTTATAPVLDVTQATQPRTPGPGVSFQPLPLDTMDSREVSRVLQARDDYKRSVFAGALAQLAQDPSLADLPACQSVEQLQTGRCLLTESLKQQVLAQGGEAVQGAAPAVAAPSPQAPAAPPVAPPSGATPPVPAAPPATTPPAAPVPQALALLAAPRPVRNASLPQIRRKLALVVGVDRYADNRVPQLENAVNDARAIARTLEDKLGYETVVLADAGKPALVATLNRLALQARPQDSVVIYYAGHGELVPSTGLGYWQLSDARADDPRGWVSNSDIGKLMGLIGASQVALISDSCYSGSLVAGERIRPNPTAPDPGAVLSRKAAVAMSSGGNEPVADEGRDGHSPFAWNLMQQLGALPAWQPGGNVFERVRFAVSRTLPQRPQYGAAPQGGHQSGSDYLFERRELAARP